MTAEYRLRPTRNVAFGTPRIPASARRSSGDTLSCWVGCGAGEHAGYAARHAAADLAELGGAGARAADLRASAERLRVAFEEQFWCEEASTYALALDGAKRPCAVKTSSPGHCLYAGIARPDRARRVAEGLLGPELFSRWGIRTVAMSEARYNPMSYHNGSVWPHDNAIAAAGFARYGFEDLVARPLESLFDTSLFLNLQRLPELFCGFHRREAEGPVLYPVACSPQAWASGAAFLLLQACLGLNIDGPRSRVTFSHSVMPKGLDRVRIENLEVGGARIDLLLEAQMHDVGITVLRKEGTVDVVILK
ncbi:MAG: hypothetical protein HYX76_08120 [Acidobacteria bacterium]|nr:hypothetical protein [Acidobacteriota bacterium]